MKTVKVTALLALLALGGGCAGQGFQEIGASVLGSTGIVTTDQAGGIFKAGGKLAKAAKSLSDEQEYYVGRGVSAMVLARHKAHPNQSLQLYVNRVGRAVANYSDRPETFGGYHFLVLNTPEINAVSAPGGFVFVTSGFIKLLPDEDALAAVLAHEVAHVVKGHGVKAISRSNLTGALLLIGQSAAASSDNIALQQLSSTFGDSINDVFETLMDKGYSRSQEYDADEYAADLLTASGYNAAALPKVLEILEQQKDSGDSGWFKTHPDPDDRREELEDDKNLVVGLPVAAQKRRAQRFAAQRRALG